MVEVTNWMGSNCSKHDKYTTQNQRMPVIGHAFSLTHTQTHLDPICSTFKFVSGCPKMDATEMWPIGRPLVHENLVHIVDQQRTVSNSIILIKDIIKVIVAVYFGLHSIVFVEHVQLNTHTHITHTLSLSHACKSSISPNKLLLRRAFAICVAQIAYAMRRITSW